ncbi:MAG: hypothetical protein GY754_12140 [bacterium]|nr:hypothetical protein [bacterium]
MNKFTVNREKCKGCGECAKQCRFSNFVTVKNGKAEYENDLSDCIECFHCLKSCPNDAIIYGANGKNELTVTRNDDKLRPVLSRRSCRFYKQEEVPKELITKIINEANMAPRFDIDFHERKFIVVHDRKNLGEVRAVVLGQIAKVKTIMWVLSKMPFFSKGKRKDYRMIFDLFEKILKINEERDALFHGAPALVMVAGPQVKTVSPDNSFYAMGQLLTVAEEHNIGTCISGFVAFFSKAVKKHLGVPKDYKIYAAAVLGFPEFTFDKYVVRNDTEIEWC